MCLLCLLICLISLSLLHFLELNPSFPKCQLVSLPQAVFFPFFLSWNSGFQTSWTTLVVRNILYVVTQCTCTHLSTHIWNSSFRKYPYHLWVSCILTFVSYPVLFFKYSLYPTILLDQRVKAFVVLLGYWYIVFHKLVPVYIPTSTVGE